VAGKRGVKSAEYQPGLFIQRNLTLEEATQCKAWVMDNEDLLSVLSDFVAAGIKCSVRHDDYGDCIACWLTWHDQGGDKRDHILTGRGRSAFTALGEVLYKLVVLYRGEFPKTSGVSSSDLWEDVK